MELVSSGVLVDKVLTEDFDVFSTLSQCGNLEWDDIEAEEKILAEAAVLYALFEVAIG